MSYANTRLRREIGQRLRTMGEERLSRDFTDASRRLLLQFEKHCEQRGVQSTGRITREVLDEFLARYERRSAGYQRYVWAIVRGLLKSQENPLALARRRIRGSGRTRVRWLTPEETEMVFEVPMTPRQRVVIGLELLMGLRRVEVVRLTAQDVTDALRTGTLRIWGKGNKQRPVPVHEDVAPALKEWLKLTDLGPEDQFLGVGRDAVNIEVRKIGMALGKRLSNHDLRRTCARNWWLAAGETDNALQVIAELLGHSNSEMTRRYIGLNVSDMRHIMDLCRVSEKCTFLNRPAPSHL